MVRWSPVSVCSWSSSAEHPWCPQHSQGSALVSWRAAEVNGHGIIDLSLPGPCWGNKLLRDGHLSSVLCATCAGGGVPCSSGLLVWGQSPVCVWRWPRSGPAPPVCALTLRWGDQYLITYGPAPPEPYILWGLM